jgi:predicted DNA-binding protein (UPF0251 family)
VWREPGVTYFKPSGKGVRELEVTLLTVDEYESIRLNDMKKLEQKEAAEKMGISQPTFHRLLQSAHEKIASALVNGNAIKIEGGEYMTEKCVPKLDGSGKGVRANRGRGGCEPQEDKGLLKGPGRRCVPGRGRRRGPPA